MILWVVGGIIAGIVWAILDNRQPVLESIPRGQLQTVLVAYTKQSQVEMEQCVDDMRVQGLGFQRGRRQRGIERFVLIKPGGHRVEASSFRNSARRTQLNIINEGSELRVEFLQAPGRKMRQSERDHLAQCLGSD